MSLWLAVLAASVAWGVAGFHRSIFRGPVARVFVAVFVGAMGAVLLLAGLLLLYLWFGGSF